MSTVAGCVGAVLDGAGGVDMSAVSGACVSAVSGCVSAMAGCVPVADGGSGGGVSSSVSWASSTGTAGPSSPTPPADADASIPLAPIVKKRLQVDFVKRKRPH